MISLPDPIEPPENDQDTTSIQRALGQQIEAALYNTTERPVEGVLEGVADTVRSYNNMREALGDAGNKLAKRSKEKLKTTLFEEGPVRDDIINQRANFPGIGISSTIEESETDLKTGRLSKEAMNRALREGRSEDFGKGVDVASTDAQGIPMLGYGGLQGTPDTNLARQVAEGARAFVGGEARSVLKKPTDVTEGGALSIFEMIGGFAMDGIKQIGPYVTGAMEMSPIFIPLNKVEESLTGPKKDRETPLGVMVENPAQRFVQSIFEWGNPGTYFSSKDQYFYTTLPDGSAARTRIRLGGVQGMFSDISQTFSMNATEHFKSVEKVTKGVEKAFKEAFGKSPSLFYSDLRRRYAEVPYSYQNDYTKAMGRVGMAAPWGGLGATKTVAGIVFRNLNRGLMGARIAAKTKLGEALKDIPFRQMMLDRSVAASAMPNSMYNLLLKYDIDADEYIKAYQKRGMSPEEATLYRRKLHAAYLGSIGGAAGMGVVEMVMDDSDIGLIIGGIGGYLAAAPAFNFARRKLAQGAVLAGRASLSPLAFMKTAMPADQFVDMMANSKSKIVTPFRRAYLYSKGFKEDQIKSLIDKSRATGANIVAEINAADTVAKKINLLEKAKNAKVFGQDAEIVDGKLVNADINIYSELNTLYKTDAKTVNMISGFNDYIESIPDKAARDRMRGALQSSFSKIDRLTSENPELMKDFPLLLDQMIQSSTLHTLRAQLVATAEYSVTNKGFVAGDLMKQLEEFNSLQQKQTETLKNMMESFKGKGGDFPDELQKALGIVKTELLDNFVTVNEDLVKSLKIIADSPFNQRKEALVRAQHRMEDAMGFDRTKLDEEEIGVLATNAFSAAFDRAKQLTDEAYDNFNIKYGDNINYRVNIADVLTEGLEEGALPSITRFANKFGIPPSIARAIEKDSAIDTLDIALRGKSPNEQYRIIVEEIDNRAIDQGILGKNLEQYRNDMLSSVVVNPVTNAARPLEQQVALLKRQLAADPNAGKTISVDSYTLLMKTLNQNLANAYKSGVSSGNFTAYNAIYQRKEKLLDAFENSFEVGDDIYDDIKIPSEVFKRTQLPFREKGSPLRAMKLQEDGLTETRMDAHEYFNLFFSGAPFKNAVNFRQAFFDEATGTYDPAAIDSLKRAIGSRLMGGKDKSKRTAGMMDLELAETYEDIERMATHLDVDSLERTVLQPFKKIFEEAGETEFISYLDDFVKHFKAPARFSAELEDRTVQGIGRALDKLKDELGARLKNSIAGEFTGPVELPSSFFGKMEGGRKIRSMKDISDLLLGMDNGGLSLFQMRGGATQFFRENLFDTNSRANELLAKKRKGTLGVSDRFGQAANAQELRYIEFLDEGRFNFILEKMLKDGGYDPNAPFVEILLKEIEKGSGKKAADEVRETLKTFFVDEWMRRAFPPVEKVFKARHKLSKYKNDYLQQIVNEGLAENVDEAIRKINFDDGTIAARMRQLDPNYSKADYEEYTFNMGYNLDMIGAGLFLKDNARAFKSIFGEQQFKVFENYVEVLNMAGQQIEKANIHSIPRGYTTAMLLGRVYNMLKGVVSPRYILGEKLIMDYRLNQANLLREVLTDPETSKAVINIFRNDAAFNKKEIRKAAKAITVHAASLGIKTKNMTEYAKDLERIAIEVRRQTPGDILTDPDAQREAEERFTEEGSLVTSTPLSRTLGIDVTPAAPRERFESLKL